MSQTNYKHLYRYLSQPQYVYIVYKYAYGDLGKILAVFTTKDAAALFEKNYMYAMKERYGAGGETNAPKGAYGRHSRGWTEIMRIEIDEYSKKTEDMAKEIIDYWVDHSIG